MNRASHHFVNKRYSQCFTNLKIRHPNLRFGKSAKIQTRIRDSDSGLSHSKIRIRDSRFGLGQFFQIRIRDSGYRFLLSRYGFEIRRESQIWVCCKSFRNGSKKHVVIFQIPAIDSLNSDKQRVASFFRFGFEIRIWCLKILRIGFEIRDSGFS